MPVLEEAPGIEAALAALQPMRGRGAEILVVDGGSRDGTPELAAAGADRVLASAPGRAAQMNAGARQARGAVLLFLHADTALPGDADRRVRWALADGRRAWGRFDVRLSGRHPALRVIEAAMNARSRWTGIATGDQALFVARPLFEAVGGFPDIPLMEDVALAARLRRHGRPACLRARVTTSSRRWERDGIARTVLLMWWLRLAFRLGVPPARLHAWYYGARAGA
jgi:rSAM/selenodomain-associated transferase 2